MRASRLKSLAPALLLASGILIGLLSSEVAYRVARRFVCLNPGEKFRGPPLGLDPRALHRPADAWVHRTTFRERYDLDRPRRAMIDFLIAERIPFVDLLLALQRSGTTGQTFYEGDVHMNQSGHAL